MIRVKNLDNIHFNVTVLSNCFQSSIFKATPGVLVFEDFEHKIYFFISYMFTI